MSWINHILPKIKREEAPKKPSPIPEGVWTKCPGCEQALYTEELDRSLRVCPKCGYHFRMGARVRLHAFLDPATARRFAPRIRCTLSTANPTRRAMRLRKLRRTKQMRLS